MNPSAGLGRVARAGTRWFGVIAALDRRLTGLVLVAIALVCLLGPRMSPRLAVGSTLGLLAIGALTWLVPPPIRAAARGPIIQLWKRAWLRRNWNEIANGCGLSDHPLRGRGRSAEHTLLRAPRLRKVFLDGARLNFVVDPLVGQTLETFVAAGERLRVATGASRIRVEPHGPSRVLITLTVGDVLADAFPARLPTERDRVLADQVPMGRREDGATWLMPVGPHTLIAGSSGSGKASVFWSFALGLANAVHSGSVQLHGVDLKGGMEILMGSELFTTSATNAAEAVGLLERLVELMQQRTQRYAGRIRSHTASQDEPLHVVMIDELAALTAYCPQRELQRRAEMAINLLCSQGRAPGFVVFACLQDPRKEVIPSRGLFTQMVGLRLKDSTETSMVLGEHAVISGADCHRIGGQTPGMGYVVPEGDGFPIRVRAGSVGDDVIRSVSRAFATSTRLDFSPAVVLAEPRARRPRAGIGPDRPEAHSPAEGPP